VINEGKRIGQQMSTLEANKALARRFYEEFWCKGNAEAADALVAEDVIQPQLPPGWLRERDRIAPKACDP
jgi:hypothetical protein